MNKRGARFLAGLAGFLMFAAPGWAQSDSPTDDNENIVVTGKAATSTEVSRQARAITDMSSAIRHEPMARFQDKLCPGVMGLEADAASLMIDRLRDNAQLLGLGLTKDDGTCRPNFIVAFVENGAENLQQIADHNGWAFQDMSPSERRKLLSEEGPVRVWTITQMRTRDGMPIPRSVSLFDPPQVNTWMAHSKIYLAIREDITRVVVLFDREGVKGKTLLQLADYATMRGLARTRPVDGEGHPMDTILALFDPSGSPPAKLTEFDRAYLAAVYDGIPNIPGVTKVLGVNRQLRLQEGEADPAVAEARE
ncbi:MAG: hypothetical protein J0I69_05865 [Altererythrobacter sp.]|nr:hypothetical protein [Altererythrobacter sp.]OJU60688.1 MAG: hypothetical protein BGO08_10975 [Altererythrobacter sp. 66-12]